MTRFIESAVINNYYFADQYQPQMVWDKSLSDHVAVLFQILEHQSQQIQL